MLSAPRVWLAGVLLVVGGCGHTPDHVHYIVPEGFRGPFAIQPNSPDGVLLAKEGEQYIIPVPMSRHLKITGHDPFRSYLPSGSFAGGKVLRVLGTAQRDSPPEEVVLWDLPTESSYDGKRSTSLHWHFVGTRAELDAFRWEDRPVKGEVFKITITQ